MILRNFNFPVQFNAIKDEKLLHIRHCSLLLRLNNTYLSQNNLNSEPSKKDKLEVENQTSRKSKKINPDYTDLPELRDLPGGGQILPSPY